MWDFHDNRHINLAVNEIYKMQGMREADSEAVMGAHIATICERLCHAVQRVEKTRSGPLENAHKKTLKADQFMDVFKFE